METHVALRHRNTMVMIMMSHPSASTHPSKYSSSHDWFHRLLDNSKFSEVLDSASSRGIYIVAKEESFRKLTALLKLKGLTVVIFNSESTIIPAITKRGGQLAYLIDIEQFDSTEMKNFETVLLPDFVPSFQTYVEILTSMARDSVRGVLHSFVTEEEDVSGLAGSLVNVLEDCGQCVPDSWRNLSASMSD
ncbi:hypothetical protein F2Q69_00010137 [Brassica cretica]|uniref:Uncharacterized protein n=1 Tax=Brassica cretica TaxID=69181 RepID=A0A8S9PK24_BRACR|nr:hypothetical protein F2Q69_00010137 [Brassica cretica]